MNYEAFLASKLKFPEAPGADPVLLGPLTESGPDRAARYDELIREMAAMRNEGAYQVFLKVTVVPGEAIRPDILLASREQQLEKNRVAAIAKAAAAEAMEETQAVEATRTDAEPKRRRKKEKEEKDTE